MNAFSDNKIKRIVSALLRGAGFFVLLAALYFLAGINFDRTKAFTQVTGSGTHGRIAVWISNQAPVAVAGVALPNDTGQRVYKGAPGNPLKVKQGVPLTLWFAPFMGTLESPTSISKDLDDENNKPEKGIYDGGACAWNDNLSVNTEEPNNFDTEIDLPTLSVGSVNQPSPPGPFPRTCVRSASHTFNDAGGTYHVFRLTDKLGAQSNVADVTITAVPAPVITSFTATPNPINQDQPFTLAWASTGTASCSSTDADFNAAIAGRTSGSAMISNLHTSPKDYVLNCASTDTDLYPSPATQTVTVTITAPVCTSFVANPTTTLKPGDPSTLSWNVPNARTCGIDQGIGGVAVNGTKEVSPNTATTYALSCSGDGAPACSQAATVSVANQQSAALAGASLDTSPNRTYANTITVTEGAPVKVYLSATGSSDSDGTITLCQWNDDFNQDPPIDYERNIAVAAPVGTITSECGTTITSIAFPLPSETGSPLGDHTYKLLTVTDDKNLASLPAVLHVNILPQLAVSLTANPASGDAPFSPTLRADITTYTGAASDTGNFSFWWDCTNISSDIGVVSAPTACGPLPSDPTPGDRICEKNANGAKCDGVPLQGQEFLSTVVAPAYTARATAYSPKVIVERGAAVNAEDRASATANTALDYTLANSGAIDAVQGKSGETTITFDHTAGPDTAASFSATETGKSALPAGVSASFSKSSCTVDCTSVLTLTVGSTVAAGTYSITVTGSPLSKTTAFDLIVRGILSCAPSTQSVVAGVTTKLITASGGTGTYSWGVFHPSNLLALDLNASPNTGTGSTFSTKFNTTGAGRIIKVTSGAQTDECTADVTAQTLTAAISAAPDIGVEPLASTITGKITSGSTAVGTINYSFWWDCANTSAIVSDAINGTAGGVACGNPDGTTNLATNYTGITCKGNSVGAKCFVDPATVTGFDPVDKALQVIHTYDGRVADYIPKVIIERGSAPSAEARYTAGITVSFPALTASCSVPATAIAGTAVSWTATAGGGSGVYTYSWAGTGDLQGKTGTPASVTYFSAGTKTGTVTVTDTTTAKTAISSQCSTAVSLPAGGAPLAVAGISRDTTANKTYRDTVAVKKGESVELHFAAKRTSAAGVTTTSSDPDGWTDQFNGIDTCQLNLDLSTEASIPDQFTANADKTFTAPATADVCVGSKTHTFNNAAENDTQISRSIVFNTLRLEDKVDLNDTDTATVVIHYQPTATLSADKTSVDSGGAVVLTWSSTHATSCTGTGFSTGTASPASGTLTVNPTADTDYSVTCTGSTLWDPVTSAKVSVVINAPTVDLKADGSDGPLSVASGAAVTLKWTSTNAASCTGTGFTASAVNNTAGVTVNPTAKTTYTISCTGITQGTATDQVVVSVTNTPPVSLAGVSKETSSSRSYSASTDVKFGVSTPLYFAAFRGTKASPVSQSSDPDGWTHLDNGVSGTGSCAFNLDLSRDAPTTYEKSIASPALATACEASQTSAYTFNDAADTDAQISKTLTYNILRITDNKAVISNEGPIDVKVHYAPTATLSADKTSVDSGAAVVLTWSSTHATSCTGTGFSTGTASPASGTLTVNPTADTDYSVTCTGSTLWDPVTSTKVSVVMSFNFTVATNKDISVAQGATTGNTNTITVTKTAGTGQAVTLSASGLPQGAATTFSPTSCTPGVAPCTSTMTITTTKGASATPVGTYPITVSGAAGTRTAAAPPFNLIVSSQMSVNLSALPSATGPAPYVMQLEAAAPASDYTGDPVDPITYTFWKKCDKTGTDVTALSATAACGVPDYEAKSVKDLTARTTDLIYTTQGTYKAKVVVVRKDAAAEDRIDIIVNPPFVFSLALDRSRIELVQGTTLSSANRAVLTHTSGDPTAVTLSAKVASIPASAPVPTITFSPSSCTPPKTGTCGSDVSVSVSHELPAGDYTVTVNAGSQSATFTLAVVSRISATLTALPADKGAAPLSAQLKVVASAYTGSLNDTLNYSFWWDCNNTSDLPSVVKDACGDPSDSAIGFKINSTLQETFTTPSSHSYTVEGVYYGKVIVERGGATREVRIPITVGTPKVSVSCAATPTTAVVNEPVTWTATAVQGETPYGFAWTKNVSCGLNPEKCDTVEMKYATAGDKFGSVTVTDNAGDTATRLCDNNVKVFQPTLVITPASAQIRADGDTLQLKALYDPDGPDGALPEQTVTATSSWSIPLAEQSKATVSAGGLVTSKSGTGNVTVSASYRDAFNNVITAEADIAVIKRDAIVCDPATQTVRIGEPTFPMKASGGTGSYDWLVQEIDANPRTGSTVGSQTFATVFSQTGTKTVNVTSGSQSGSCGVTVTGQNLSVNLSAFPASVTVPQETRLTAVVSGNALGTMGYAFWWNCGSDKDADNTTRVEIAEGRCGVLPTDVLPGQCRENQHGAKCNAVAATTQALNHAYQETGMQTPKVIVERGNAPPAQHKASVAVDAANAPPNAVAGISQDVNATRLYTRSLVITQNVPTRIYFAAFTGEVNAADEKSTDPNGWANALNGVYHPDSPSASGQCAWNADLDRDAQVSFEDVSGTNRNPASEKECVTSFVHNFAETGTYTYAVLRITDNRGAVSGPALVTVDVVPAGAPIAVPGVSANPSAERIYREIVRVKQGEDTELWVSARRRVGAADVVSSDPDGWKSKNGGVAKGGSCRWNRDLDKGVFPTGVPTYEYALNDPQDPAEDCDTKVVNDAGTSFIRVFNDAPRENPYSFEALRIFDNTGLRSNKGMIQVQVLPSDPPLAVASASTDNGVTFGGTITVVRGAPTPIIFSAAGSTDPDGWNNPVNGVAASGHCNWNRDLNTGIPTFEVPIPTPASPSVCDLSSRTYTFNDRPGVIDFDMLKITDNKGFTSVSPGGVSVLVTAPDLVISDGPLPVNANDLVENGSAAFRGKVKNQGDAPTPAAFGTVFRVDFGNNGSTDAILASTPATVSGIAVGAEREITSMPLTGLPAGTHKVTLCADQPSPAVANEYFTDNNCASQVITVLPDNRPPSAEAGISVDGITYGPSITVLRGAPVQIWLSADKDIDGNVVASFDPDGWTSPEKGVSAGGKCDWNIDLQSTFAAQNTVNNPASPTLCNRNRMDKTFNDPPGTYIYPVLRITDAKGAASSVAAVSVRVVSSAAQLTHMECVADACTVTSGAGANVCSVAGALCTGGGGPSGVLRPDLLVSRSPRLLGGRLERGTTVTFGGRVQNRSGVEVLSPFKNAFLIDLNDNGTIEVSLRALPRMVSRLTRAQLAALPISDLTLPLPATVASLGIDEETAVLSGEWRNIPEGTHRVYLCADSDGEIIELDEDNNCESSIVQVTGMSSSGGPLRVDSCSVSDSEVRAGQLVDWTAHATGGTGAYSFSWSGDAPLEGTVANPVSVAYQTTGTKSGSVIATSGNETASRSCGTVNVLAGIIAFTANPRQINSGETSTLSWNTVGFNSCVITADQVGQSIGSVATTGTSIIQPPRNTVYTLTCDAQGDSQSVTVVVTSIPSFEEVIPE